tara:strand:- start:101 stop:574 length:474 start_codon:yes stop_codon:yes gene_type:complete
MLPLDTMEIKEAGFQIQYDSTWQIIENQYSSEKVTYVIAKKPGLTKSVNNHPPSVAIVVENFNSEIEIEAYSAIVGVHKHRTVLQNLSPEDEILQYSNSVGYLTSFIDKAGIGRVSYVIHAINGLNAITIVTDCRATEFKAIKSEFEHIIQSLEVTN